jgi:hypothetical protein
LLVDQLFAGRLTTAGFASGPFGQTFNVFLDIVLQRVGVGNDVLNCS